MTVEQLIAKLMKYDLETEVEIVTTDNMGPVSWTIEKVTETITHKRKWDPPYVDDINKYRDEWEDDIKTVVYILQDDDHDNQEYLHPQAQRDLGLRE
jgi:hypothetical protein